MFDLSNRNSICTRKSTLCFDFDVRQEFPTVETSPGLRIMGQGFFFFFVLESTICVTLGKPCGLSVPQYPHQYKVDNNAYYLIGLLQGLSVIIGIIIIVNRFIFLLPTL